MLSSTKGGGGIGDATRSLFGRRRQTTEARQSRPTLFDGMRRPKNEEKKRKTPSDRPSVKRRCVSLDASSSGARFPFSPPSSTCCRRCRCWCCCRCCWNVIARLGLVSGRDGHFAVALRSTVISVQRRLGSTFFFSFVRVSFPRAATGVCFFFCFFSSFPFFCCSHHHRRRSSSSRCRFVCFFCFFFIRFVSFRLAAGCERRRTDWLQKSAVKAETN